MTHLRGVALVLGAYPVGLEVLLSRRHRRNEDEALSRRILEAQSASSPTWRRRLTGGRTDRLQFQSSKIYRRHETAQYAY